MNKKFLAHLLLCSFYFITAFAQTKSQNSLQIRDLAPKFVLQNLKGEDVFIRNYCGQLRQPWKNKTKHVVFLSFFTTYCKPCLKEIPDLEKISTEYSDEDLI